MVHLTDPALICRLTFLPQGLSQLYEKQLEDKWEKYLEVLEHLADLFAKKYVLTFLCKRHDR